jgi:hypothetical protein
MNDLTTACDLLNGKLVGVPLNEVVERMIELQPLLAASVQRHEMLFEAFVNAFLKFANDQYYFSGQSNMLYQPEFADNNSISAYAYDAIGCLNYNGIVKGNQNNCFEAKNNSTRAEAAVMIYRTFFE